MNQGYEDFIKQDFTSFSKILNSLNAYEFSLLATTIGFLISPTLTVNQQNSLGNFFELLGQVILTINAQNTTLNQNKLKKSKINIDVSNDFKKEIEELKKEVIQLRADILGNN